MKKLILLALLLVACKTEPETVAESGIAGEGLEGTWTVSGELDDGDFSWFATYTFEGENYTLTGYPPIDDKGTYKVLSHEGSTYTLEVSPISPDNEDRYQIVVTLAEGGKTLDLNGQIYTRVK